VTMGFGAGMGAMRGGMAGGMVGMSATGVLGLLIALALSVPVAAAMWFAPALVMLRGVAPVEAVKESFAACLKNLIPFLVYGVAGLVLALVASIPFGLGWLALGPVLGISVYTAYKDLFGGGGPAVARSRLIASEFASTRKIPPRPRCDRGIAGWADIERPAAFGRTPDRVEGRFLAGGE
ncbi:MAG TPA: BPSS1780 family membrane protein, partial [Burkholderiales bacterium]